MLRKGVLPRHFRKNTSNPHGRTKPCRDPSTPPSPAMRAPASLRMTAVQNIDVLKTFRFYFVYSYTPADYNDNVINMSVYLAPTWTAECNIAARGANY